MKIHKTWNIKSLKVNLSKDSFESIINSDISSKNYIGFIGHPDIFTSYNQLPTPALLLTGMKFINDEELDCEFEILLTNAGKVISHLIDDGVDWHIDVRGTGHIDENNNVVDFKLLGFDFMLDIQYGDA